jgi:fused signal recognition particle receptor
LEDLQDVLLQADLGMATAEDIVEEVKSLREDSTEFFSRDDLMSIMRGKLIETLETGNGAIRFATPEEKWPTVLFIMGANGMGK